VTATNTGDRLFDIVSGYAGVAEHHRSGTPEGQATIDWFADQLRALGAGVQVQEYDFQRFDARWEVRIDGETVPSIPYFYAGLGKVKTARPFTASLAVRPPAEMVGVYEDLERQAEAAGAIATVTATLSECGELFAHNSAIREPGPMPHLGVAGRFAERLPEARVEVDFEAKVVPGRSANVVGELGDGDPAQAILLTTSISGWFRCAGERGSGIALMLELASELAKERRVRIVATSNHEHSHDGLHACLARPLPPMCAILHFGGSSVTVVPGPGGPGVILNPRFRVAGWAGAGRSAALQEAYAPLDRMVRIPSDDERREWQVWQGEAAEWAPLGLPLVTHSGRGPYTHTDHDLPELATSGEALAAVYECDLRAARLIAGGEDA
jgi:hypothetical protein